jgi:hypothetical protein
LARAGNLDLALRSFISSYDRFPAGQDTQLVDVITAAEAILGTESEITFRLAFRVAGMLGRTTAERVQVFNDMKRFYDVRSKIVHGAVLKGWRPEMLARADDARELVRRLLVAFTRLAASSPPTRYTKKFFEEDLDSELQDEQARRAYSETSRLAERSGPSVIWAGARNATIASATTAGARRGKQ